MARSCDLRVLAEAKSRSRKNGRSHIFTLARERSKDSGRLAPARHETRSAVLSGCAPGARALRCGQAQIRHNLLRSAFGTYSVFLLTYASRSARRLIMAFLSKSDWSFSAVDGGCFPQRRSCLFEQLMKAQVSRLPLMNSGQHSIPDTSKS